MPGSAISSEPVETSWETCELQTAIPATWKLDLTHLCIKICDLGNRKMAAGALD